MVRALLAADNRGMNPLLGKLRPYPFERLRELSRAVTPNPALRPISLGLANHGTRHPSWSNKP